MGSATDKGLVRESNQDSYLALAYPGSGGFLAVADGMGGADDGDVASAIAISYLKDRFQVPDPDPGSSLVEAFGEINSLIFREGVERRGFPAMGTTLTAACVTGQSFVVAHVGDSRAYLLRDGSITRLTEDHSLVGQLVRRGQISEEEAMVHPQRNVLTQALGPEANASVDVRRGKVEPGDVLLLCTDGLTGAVEAKEIAATVAAHPDPAAAAARLVEMAIERGGTDNVTVVIGVIDGQAGARE